MLRKFAVLGLSLGANLASLLAIQLDMYGFSIQPVLFAFDRRNPNSSNIA